MSCYRIEELATSSSILCRAGRAAVPTRSAKPSIDSVCALAAAPRFAGANYGAEDQSNKGKEHCMPV